jgi:plastocyanin
MAIRLTLRKMDLVSAGLALGVFLFGVLPVVIVYRSHFMPIKTSGTQPVVTVSQRGRTFHPNTLTITQGTILHIVNNDTVTHNIYVDSRAMNYDSRDQPEGTSVNIEFDQPGTFRVLCHIHPTMHLVVTVK